MFWNTKGPIKIIVKDGRKYRIKSIQAQDDQKRKIDFSVKIKLKPRRLVHFHWTEEEDLLLNEGIARRKKAAKGKKATKVRIAWTKVCLKIRKKVQYKFYRTPNECRKRWQRKNEENV